MFLITTLLLKGLHKYYHNICELFSDVKMGDKLFGVIHKERHKNGHIFCTTTVKFIFVNISPVHNPKIKFVYYAIQK